jgi:cell division protease FtsH
MTRTKVYSEDTAHEIDEEIKHIIDGGYTVAQNIILNNRDKLELIASSLLEYETLDRAQVGEIIKTGKFTPPPPKPQSGTILSAPAGTPLPEIPPKPVPPKLPGLGTPSPAPA